MMNDLSIVNNIYRYMALRDISDKEMANSLSIPSFSYYNIVKRNIIFSEDDYVRIANLLGITLQQLKYSEIYY